MTPCLQKNRSPEMYRQSSGYSRDTFKQTVCMWSVGCIGNQNISSIVYLKFKAFKISYSLLKIYLGNLKTSSHIIISFNKYSLLHFGKTIGVLHFRRSYTVYRVPINLSNSCNVMHHKKYTTCCLNANIEKKIKKFQWEYMNFIKKTLLQKVLMCQHQLKDRN